MKKRLYLPLFVLVLLAFASAASACETCKTVYPGTVSCWSGAAKGWDWCFGGWGEPCTGDGQCPYVPPFEGGAAPTTPGETVCGDGVLGCTDAQPAGFALEQPSAVSAPEVKEAV